LAAYAGVDDAQAKQDEPHVNQSRFVQSPEFLCWGLESQELMSFRISLAMAKKKASGQEAHWLPVIRSALDMPEIYTFNPNLKSRKAVKFYNFLLFIY
jgi:hypothetical protein